MLTKLQTCADQFIETFFRKGLQNGYFPWKLKRENRKFELQILTGNVKIYYFCTFEAFRYYIRINKSMYILCIYNYCKLIQKIADVFVENGNLIVLMI